MRPEQIISRAQQQAAIIDERARQEFAWRRRQMRHEQDLLDRRKVAMFSQLTSLSALAVESAKNFPEVPELSFEDVGEFADHFPGDGDSASLRCRAHLIRRERASSRRLNV